MASMTTSGFDDVYNQLRRLGDEAGEVVEEMIDAGAEAVRKAWHDSAERHKHIRTGEMIASIASVSPDKRSPNAVFREIYPQGTDSKGMRNAAKAYILHYGTTRIPASYWVDEAEAAADAPMNEAMREVWDRYIASH